MVAKAPMGHATVPGLWHQLQYSPQGTCDCPWTVAPTTVQPPGDMRLTLDCGTNYCTAPRWHATDTWLWHQLQLQYSPQETCDWHLTVAPTTVQPPGDMRLTLDCSTNYCTAQREHATVSGGYIVTIAACMCTHHNGQQFRFERKTSSQSVME